LDDLADGLIALQTTDRTGSAPAAEIEAWHGAYSVIAWRAAAAGIADIDTRCNRASRRIRGYATEPGCADVDQAS